jgi:hypothetical protein
MSRRAVARIVAVGVTVVALLAACSAEPTPSEPPQALLAADLSFTCGTFIFPAAALSGPTGAERADDPAAHALVTFLGRRDPVLEDLPKKDYRVLISGEDLVVFATEAISTGGLVAIAVEHGDSGWKARLTPPCEPRLSLPGLNAATWSLDTDELSPPPDATGFVALVSETVCVSGRRADGRILPPLIIREPTRVLVIFAIQPPPPAPGGLENCAGPAPTRVRVELGEPLGERELLDGGVFPPQNVQQSSCCG